MPVVHRGDPRAAACPSKADAAASGGFLWATADALAAVVGLDLDTLAAITPPRGYGRD